jgi:hypothetical protein
MSTTAIDAGWIDPGDAFLVSLRNYHGNTTDAFTIAIEANPLFSANQPLSGYEAITDIDRVLDQGRSNVDLNFADLKIWTATASNETSAFGEVLLQPEHELASQQLNGTLDGGRNRLLAPSEIQMGVLSLVDAMAAFGNGLADQRSDPHPVSETSHGLQSSAAVFVSPNTTSQLVHALRQFDANGNAITGQSGQHTAVNGLAATDSGKPADNSGGLLAVGRG